MLPGVNEDRAVEVPGEIPIVVIGGLHGVFTQIAGHPGIQQGLAVAAHHFQANGHRPFGRQPADHVKLSPVMAFRRMALAHQNEPMGGQGVGESVPRDHRLVGQAIESGRFPGACR